ncbi:hypothetical protein PRIPAC_96897 [Pristionchus pacificus]|uniref:Uncharacterized protein n=1 Tax=Pristionchus pacificus TaxID=54126 RepID=A0A2A6BIP2_PRIPA|nr:hypothetical protein PRIPAC_96897 [Pristionchus pacificus]|eukprot:PDM65774.1 hypothetical protein PRIPAC_45175 [Pristionchus pacificus]
MALKTSVGQPIHDVPVSTFQQIFVIKYHDCVGCSTTLTTPKSASPTLWDFSIILLNTAFEDLLVVALHALMGQFWGLGSDRIHLHCPFLPAILRIPPLRAVPGVHRARHLQRARGVLAAKIQQIQDFQRDREHRQGQEDRRDQEIQEAQLWIQRDRDLQGLLKNKSDIKRSDPGFPAGPGGPAGPAGPGCPAGAFPPGAPGLPGLPAGPGPPAGPGGPAGQSKQNSGAAGADMAAGAPLDPADLR